MLWWLSACHIFRSAKAVIFLVSDCLCSFTVLCGLSHRRQTHAAPFRQTSHLSLSLLALRPDQRSGSRHNSSACRSSACGAGGARRAGGAHRPSTAAHAESG